MKLWGYRLIIVMLAALPVLARADLNDTVFAAYQRLLTAHLTETSLPGDGLVSAFDYAGALADVRVPAWLEQQHRALASFDPETLNGRDQAIAFWINAYNFSMISRILEDRPGGRLVTSVWDYGGRINPFVKSVFEQEAVVVGGQHLSLDFIEKEILLGPEYQARGWKDARVHFAVNCASVGCPPLRRQIYTADNLQAMLAENTRRALNTPYHLQVRGDTVYVSELFRWYEKDFAGAEGSVRAFILRWAGENVRAQVQATTELDFIPYDWSLNRPENFAMEAAQ